MCQVKKWEFIDVRQRHVELQTCIRIVLHYMVELLFPALFSHYNK